jgi:hypothetical protein
MTATRNETHLPQDGTQKDARVVGRPFSVRSFAIALKKMAASSAALGGSASALSAPESSGSGSSAAADVESSRHTKKARALKSPRGSMALVKTRFLAYFLIAARLSFK